MKINKISRKNSFKKFKNKSKKKLEILKNKKKNKKSKKKNLHKKKKNKKGGANFYDKKMYFIDYITPPRGISGDSPTFTFYINMCENNNYNNKKYLIDYIDITRITIQQIIIELIKKVRESNDLYYDPLKIHITTYLETNDVGYFQIVLKKYSEDFFNHCIEYLVKPRTLKKDGESINCQKVKHTELFKTPFQISNLSNLLNESNI